MLPPICAIFKMAAIENKNLLFHISLTVSHKTLILGLMYTYPGIIISNMVYLGLSDIHICHFERWRPYSLMLLYLIKYDT